MESTSETMPDTSKADHLCVLVHGDDNLYILCPKTNSGNYTYDGIELGGERIVHEIEETLESLAEKGQKITKISVIGYSLGGLLARYAIGLLNARGWLDRLEPMNFTTFATPHVGVRAPLKGYKDQIFNVLGPRTISASGRQMWLIDSFRDTGRPLLGVLADPESIFIAGLKKFRQRSVYANIVNDRSVAFYTSGLSKVDPFRDLEDVKINYVKGYEDVIIDPDLHVLPPAERKAGTVAGRFWKKVKSVTRSIPLSLLLLVLVPLASVLFLINAGIQTFRSSKRIRLHEVGENGKRFGRYRVPVLIQDVQHVMEQAFENVNAIQEPAYLSNSDTEVSEVAPEKSARSSVSKSAQNDAESESVAARHSSTTEVSTYPKLALTHEQFGIIDSLNAVGIRKYPVHIQKHHHSHAAIIVRVEKDGFREGKIVMKHWLDNEFAL
ncbi:Lipase/serine esterase, putative [Penicillium digitatum PHI26]|uniref:Lipase/serine esterase, putative n=2 Tax=Penicillium digitatum TaxID=36651 RepID=K9FL62_PEND2|nr:Lipase/serine esterase, putative [Penicillium digitatum Pd1]EKV07474.1 Lipase/serine esterase, putative [Penicillium digitatum Pd1]EKV09017.1 Lipase/serine esterase, putative [Penicillium digitatum PHI26]